MRKGFLLQVVIGIVAFAMMGFQRDNASAESEIEQIQRAIEAQGANWVAGENWVTKLPPEEQKKLYGGIRKPVDPSQATLLSLPRLENLPPAFGPHANVTYTLNERGKWKSTQRTICS